MRAVGTPTAFGTAAGASDAPSAGPQATGPANGHGAGGHAVPFASMLATRLAKPRTEAAPSSGEGASETDDRADEGTALQDAAPAPGVLAAVATVMSTPPTTAVTSAVTMADVRHVSRDVGALAPALRERLGRVVARMQREYGHDVRIAESGRTQARQDYLFAQGRTRSGPVVTWTRDSAHTRGRAVDVTIDGGYDDPTAFARLQQIAGAEGLHTLGARDPGHLELPRDVPGEVPVLSFGEGGAARVTVESFGVRTEPGVARPPSAAPTGVAAVAPVAQVASVAGVADVAQVAAVASLAAPGSAAPGSAARDVEHPADHGPSRDVTRARAPHARDADSAAPTFAAAGTSASDSARNRGEGDRSGEHATDHGTDTREPRVAPRAATEAASPATAPAPASVGAVAPGTAAPTSPAAPSAAASGAPPILGAVAAERIARVLDAQQAAAPRTVSHLTLRVERAEGGADRIRLDLRGRAVEARIDVADLGAADHLTARTPELRAALAQHGLTTDGVRVRSGSDAALDAQTRPEVRASGVVAERGEARAATTASDGPRDATALATTTLGDAGGAGTGSFGTSSQHTGDGSPRDQPSGHTGGRNDRQSDDSASERAPRDGGGAERRASDQRQGRRPPPDAYLDAPAPRTTGAAKR